MNNCNSVSFGIYIGNSTCCISVNKSGNADVVANASGERVTPSVVGFHDSEVVTGTAAKQGLVQHDKCSVVGALMAIGSTSVNDRKFPLDLKCQISCDGKKNKFVLQKGEKTRMIAPEEVLQHLFKLLKEIASTHSSDNILPVVITLPAWVTDSSISAVHHSANLAGFQVIKTISQPAAACLTYDLLDDNETNINVLMFNCGGTSIVATLGEISGGLLSIKETAYSYSSSGDTLTLVLVDHFAKEFYMKYKGNPLESRRSKRKLYSASENCKHVLSTMTASQLHVESLWEGVDFSTQMSRGRFDGLVGSSLSEFLVPIKEVLQTANLTPDQIDKVILSGGSCKIPKLQSMISDMFRKAEILKKFPADETSAIGASKEAFHYLNAKKVPVQTPTCLLSCLSMPIYAKILERQEKQCVFTKGIPTHSRQSLTFECPLGPCNLVIFEGYESSNFPADVQILAQVELNFNGASDLINLQMDCTLKSDGHLVVKLLEPSSKVKKSFIIEAICS